MAKQIVNIGTTANDGTGDPLRIAFDKINDNFDELYSSVVTSTSDITNDSGFITANSIPTNVSELVNDAGYALATDIPNAVSELTNDTGYITANTDHIILNARYTLGDPVTFSNESNTALQDEIGPGLAIKRNPGGGGIYNPYQETEYDQTNRDSPLGAEWNWEGNGLGNLDTAKNRYYTTFSESLKHAIGRNIIGAGLIMHDTINDKYYTFEFTHWGIQGAGTFAYTRREIIIDNIGVEFPDGSYQPTAWKGLLEKYNKIHVGPYSGHELGADETGSVVYFYNTHVILPNDEENNCPIGSFYTLVVGNAAASLRVKKYDDTTTIPTIESAIEPNLNVGPFLDTEYSLEPFSVAHLIKIEKNKWSLVPAGFQTFVSSKSDSDLELSSNNDININTSVGDENHTFEFKDDGTFYMAKNPVSNNSIISTPRNDTAANLALVGAIDVKIETNEGAGTLETWTFGADGTLEFPDATIQTTAWTGIIDWTNVSNKPSIPVNINDLGDVSLSMPLQNGDVLIYGDGVWFNEPISNFTSDLVSVGSEVSLLSNDAGYITTSALTGFATETFVTSQGYLTSLPSTIESNLNGSVLGANNVILVDHVNNKLFGNIESDGVNITATNNGSVQIRSNGSTVQISGQSAAGTITYNDTDGGIQVATSGSINVITSSGAINVGTFAGGGDITIGNGVNQIVNNSILKLNDGVHEKYQSIAGATGVVEHDCSNGHIFYHTSPDADWTANLTNLNLASTYATNVTIVISQGITGYYPSALQIGGVSQTIQWQGGVTPTPSTSRTDAVTFSILNNGGNFTVLGQLTGF